MTRLQTLSRERLLIVLAAAAVGLLLLDRVLVTPLLARWRAASDEVDALRAQLTQGGAVVGQEARWLRWRDEAEARLLPAEAGAAESVLLTQVDGWARQAGLTVQSLRPRWQEIKGQGNRPELQVVGSGPMAAVALFLHQVETSPLAVAVEHLVLAGTGKAGAPLRLELRLSGLCQAPAAPSSAVRRAEP